MKTRLYNFSEDTNEFFVFRWTRKHYEFCMDNDIFLNHRGKKVYKEICYCSRKVTKLELKLMLLLNNIPQCQ